jgi:Na+-translocating ferredoxin:NAD+ oxidoreductase RnfE subunit
VNNLLRDHPFWGLASPLTSLTGAGLMVVASGRVASALICAAALVWVYCFTVFAGKLGGKYFPRWGRGAALLFLSALAAGLFMILLWVFDPVLALESAFFIFLVPVIGTASEVYGRAGGYDILEALSQSLTDALVLGVLLLALALVREPLGYGSLSLPGLGLVRFFREEPLRIFQAASGALILLGYGTAIYRYFRNRETNSEDE